VPVRHIDKHEQTYVGRVRIGQGGSVVDVVYGRHLTLRTLATYHLR
jgi:hypothetical protein